MDALIHSNSFGIADTGMLYTPTNPLLLQNSDQSFDMAGSGHSSHPDFGHLVLLVFEAVMEVVCVSLPGYIVARMGMFDSNSQKFVANLNITLFTPCLIFSKLASQLSGDKLLDLGIIPVILVVQTFVSWASAVIIARLFKLNKKPQKNFVVAMAAFGNSNSLPLSLVISLSKTISGLHWAKLPGDNDDEVAARGILYLLVFSQFGQALRWSWGMNTLLKPVDQYTLTERGELSLDSEAGSAYQDSPASTRHGSVAGLPDSELETASGTRTPINQEGTVPGRVGNSVSSTTLANDSSNGGLQQRHLKLSNGNVVLDSSISGVESSQLPEVKDAAGITGWYLWTKGKAKQITMTVAAGIADKARIVFKSFPEPAQKGLRKTGWLVKVIWVRIVSCLNVPLVAIIVSLIVATVPALQRLFFTPGTFINNSITRAISQSGGVAVPLILVVLGANLARNTLPDSGLETPQYRREERNMLIASLLCRMLIPTIIMAPLLAITAKFVPISILGDPIFIIVCFLLTGAPSALQLAQMCQVNNVFVGAVSKLLFHSYVIWILPSTLILVVMALEVVKWAQG